MLTYDLAGTGLPLYDALYRAIKEDILAGRLPAGEKMPSKRMLAQHLRVSVVTVQNAYAQLVAEGYLSSREKKGYFVENMGTTLPVGFSTKKEPLVEKSEKSPGWFADFVSNSIAAEDFPFSVWSKTMRSVILEKEKALLAPMAATGTPELRAAIARHLARYRGLSVSPEQVVVGAGTEYLYTLVLQLLGRDKLYAVENPGYGKIARVYRANGVRCCAVPLDSQGLSLEALIESGADCVHISPSHHYPTGIVTPIGRRRELLHWAAQKPERYIIDDDYDSEFRFAGRPIPTMMSIDENEKVIYMNTFSKSISPSIRISYMVLPRGLLERFRQELGFYSCTVSGFEQFTLARFMEEGHFERHLNRMKNRYRMKRDAVIAAIRESPFGKNAAILEQNAGLHFLLRVKTDLPDAVVKKNAAALGVRINALSDYLAEPQSGNPAEESTYTHIFVVNYSGVDTETLPDAMRRFYRAVYGETL